MIRFLQRESLSSHQTSRGTACYGLVRQIYCIIILYINNYILYSNIFRLFAHADDADIDEPMKPDVGHTLGVEDKTPG